MKSGIHICTDDFGYLRKFTAEYAAAVRVETPPKTREVLEAELAQTLDDVQALLTDLDVKRMVHSFSINLAGLRRAGDADATLSAAQAFAADVHLMLVSSPALEAVLVPVRALVATIRPSKPEGRRRPSQDAVAELGEFDGDAVSLRESEIADLVAESRGSASDVGDSLYMMAGQTERRDETEEVSCDVQLPASPVAAAVFPDEPAPPASLVRPSTQDLDLDAAKKSEISGIVREDAAPSERKRSIAEVPVTEDTKAAVGDLVRGASPEGVRRSVTEVEKDVFGEGHHEGRLPAFQSSHMDGIQEET